MKYPPRYVKAGIRPWDLAQTDLSPVPVTRDLVRHVRVSGRSERHLGLSVVGLDAFGASTGTIGILAIRCVGRSAVTEDPVSVALVSHGEDVCGES